MADLFANALTDVPYNSPQIIDNSGQDSIGNLQQLNAGSGASTMRFDQRGLWIGGDTPANAPFFVDINGNLIATSAQISGEIDGASIDIGGNDSTSFHVDATGNMWLGNALFASAPFAVTAGGLMTATGVQIKDGFGTAYIDSYGLISAQNFPFVYVAGAIASQTTSSTTPVDVTGVTQTFTLARAAQVWVMWSVTGLIDGDPTNTASRACYAYLNVDGSDTGNPNILIGTSFGTSLSYSVFSDQKTFGTVLTLGSGSHTLKLRFKTTNATYAASLFNTACSITTYQLGK